MESEENFLTVAFEMWEDKIVGHEVTYGFNIKRSCIIRESKPNERYKRICIDFDPRLKQIGFVVGFTVDKKEGGVTRKNHPRFCYVVDEQEEARQLQKSLREGKDYKIFLENSEKAVLDTDGNVKAEIWPVLITEK